MAEKYYRLPIANSVIKISSIEYVTPVAPFNNSNNNFGFRVVYNNYAPIPRASFAANNGVAPNTFLTVQASMENGFNATLTSANAELLESYRTDLINVMTDNGINLVDNFPND